MLWMVKKRPVELFEEYTDHPIKPKVPSCELKMVKKRKLKRKLEMCTEDTDAPAIVGRTYGQTDRWNT